MGSGKTTLGRRLALDVGVVFEDLDMRLEARLGRTLGDVLRQDGEARFRAFELDTLREFVARAPARCVVATGGGIVETEAAHALLRSLGTVVWLRADPGACVARLGAARAGRPLLDDPREWAPRYARREPLYRRLAAHVVDTHPQDEATSLAELIALYEAPAAS